MEGNDPYRCYVSHETLHGRAAGEGASSLVKGDAETSSSRREGAAEEASSSLPDSGGMAGVVSMPPDPPRRRDLWGFLSSSPGKEEWRGRGDGTPTPLSPYLIHETGDWEIGSLFHSS